MWAHIYLASSHQFLIMRHVRILLVVVWRIIVNFRIFGHWLKFVFHVEIMESTRLVLKALKRLGGNLDIWWMALLFLVWLKDWVLQRWLGDTWSLSLHDLTFYRTWRLRWLSHNLMLIVISEISRHIGIINLLLIPHFYKRATNILIKSWALCSTYITGLFLRHASRLY